VAIEKLHSQLLDLREDCTMPSWLDFHQIADWVSGAWWSYPLIFAVAMVDAFFPVVPSETVIIIGGNLSASGDLSLPLVILVGAAGAVVGDNISYGIGTLVGERTVKRWFSSEKAHKRLEWAERMLDERGAYIILVARFIPGGRVAVTFSSGYVPTFPWRRFIVYDVVACLLWASYAALLGYFGGKFFEDHPWLGLLIALGIALSLGLIVEAVRHYRQRRSAAA
jgi:membrane protein DedA with SNARE-associated domain